MRLSLAPFCSFIASMNLRVPELAIVPKLDRSCSRVMPMPESLFTHKSRVVGWSFQG